MSEERSFNEKSFMSLIDGDKNLFASLLELFEKDCPDLLDKLEAAVRENDSKTVEQVGHRIKGNLRNFYAEEAAKIALAFEEGGRENQLQGLSDRVAELRSAIDTVQGDLKSYYHSL